MVNKIFISKSLHRQTFSNNFANVWCNYIPLLEVDILIALFGSVFKPGALEGTVDFLLWVESEASLVFEETLALSSS